MASRDDIEAMSHAMEILKLQLVEKDNEIEDMKQDYSNLEQVIARSCLKNSSILLKV